MKMGLIPNYVSRRLMKYLKNRFISKGGLVRKEVLGHDMVLDIWSHGWILVRGLKYEPQTTQYVMNSVKEGDTVIDIGASLGYYTLILARLVGPSGTVYAFEPLPNYFKILKRNVQANGYDNVVLVNKAVSNSDGTARFYIPHNSFGMSSLFPHTKPKEIINVETVCIDSYDLKDVNLIKIDVEGAEASVLKGMKQLLMDSPNIRLILEFTPHRIGYDADSIFDQLNGWNYQLLEENIIFSRSGLE